MMVAKTYIAKELRQQMKRPIQLANFGVPFLIHPMILGSKVLGSKDCQRQTRKPAAKSAQSDHSF
jgi:hypothetical protein